MEIRPYEQGRFFVRTTNGEEYLVDIDEFGGNGWCGCFDFSYKRLPKVSKEFDVFGKVTENRCKHIKAVLEWRSANPTHADLTPQ